MVIFFSSFFSTHTHTLLLILVDLRECTWLKIKVIVLMNKHKLLCSRHLQTIGKENLTTLKSVLVTLNLFMLTQNSESNSINWWHVDRGRLMTSFVLLIQDNPPPFFMGRAHGSTNSSMLPFIDLRLKCR
jgi:hypothetical protein